MLENLFMKLLTVVGTSIVIYSNYIFVWPIKTLFICKDKINWYIFFVRAFPFFIQMPRNVWNPQRLQMSTFQNTQEMSTLLFWQIWNVYNKGPSCYVPIIDAQVYLIGRVRNNGLFPLSFCNLTWPRRGFIPS